MGMAQEEVKRYVNEMYRQHGGKAWEVCCGVRVAACGEDKDGNPYLLMKLPSLKEYLPDAKVRPNHYKCTLDLGMDEYKIEYYYFKPEQMRYDKSNGTVKTIPEKRESVYKADGIYCDQLQDIFEKQTGLLCDFCRVRFG